MASNNGGADLNLTRGMTKGCNSYGSRNFLDSLLSLSCAQVLCSALAWHSVNWKSVFVRSFQCVESLKVMITYC
jgi:hypothetical protein